MQPTSTMLETVARPNRRAPIVIQDIMVGAPPGVSMKRAKMPETRQKSIVLNYDNRGTLRAGFSEPEYDLSEIYRAMDTESYMRLSFDKHEELILKNQWMFVSQNERMLEYVLRRITEICWGQDEAIERIIEKGVEDLVETSNVFYVTARKETGPRYKSRFRRNLYPISGIFSPNPASLRPFVQMNAKGQKEIRYWRQMVGGVKVAEFRPVNVSHLAFRQKRGNIFGTPFVMPVLDDILCLRRLEELVEIVVHKHAFPFFHYKVGTDQRPAREYDGGGSDIENIKTEIAGMPFEGGLVTPHWHEIVVLGAQGKALNVEPYMKYFEARVLSGLNLSGIDIGRGETANRATAQTMSKGLADRCTRMQLAFATWFTFAILDELILEAGEMPTPENRVYLQFPTIDSEESRARENHAMALYQGHLISETEARIRINMDPVKDAQRSDMFFKRILEPSAIIKAVDEPYTKEAKAGMGGGASTANKERPVNQNKRLASKPTVAANAAAQLISTAWANNRDQVLTELDGPSLLAADIEHQFGPWVERWLGDGFERYKEEEHPSRDMYVGDNIKAGFLDDVFRPALRNFCRGLWDLMGKQTSAESRGASLDAFRPEAIQLGEMLARMAVNYGYARAAQIDKKKEVYWKLADSACEFCRERNQQGPLLIHRFDYEDLFHHPSCSEDLAVFNHG